jgi:hypothetical protein
MHILHGHSDMPVSNMHGCAREKDPRILPPVHWPLLFKLGSKNAQKPFKIQYYVYNCVRVTKFHTLKSSMSSQTNGAVVRWVSGDERMLATNEPKTNGQRTIYRGFNPIRSSVVVRSYRLTTRGHGLRLDTSIASRQIEGKHHWQKRSGHTRAYSWHAIQ